MSVYGKLLAAQKAVHAISKTGFNEHFRYKFFEEREVLQVTRDALNNAGLAFFYSVEDVSDREVETKKGNIEWLTDVRMICTIYDAESGESLTGKAIGRGQDGQDKGVNKAIVAGLKYWLLKTLMIPTEDDTERDENTNAEGNQRTRSAPQRTPPNSQPVGVTHSNAFDLGEAIQVGKHKGKSWAELVETDPQYVEWAVQNLSRLTDAAKQVLRAALALHHAPANSVPLDRNGVPLNQPEPDGLPY